MKKFVPFLFLPIVLILSTTPNAFGHAINYAMEKANGGQAAAFYTKLGIAHILPYGFDQTFERIA
jgi:hypothetical protein